MWISCRKVRISVVAVLLATGLGLAVSVPAAAGHERAAVTEQGLFTPAKALAWFSELWQELSGFWSGGAIDKDVVEVPGPLDDGNTTSEGGDEGPAIDPNGG